MEGDGRIVTSYYCAKKGRNLDNILECARCGFLLSFAGNYCNYRFENYGTRR